MLNISFWLFKLVEFGRIKMSLENPHRKLSQLVPFVNVRWNSRSSSVLMRNWTFRDGIICWMSHLRSARIILLSWFSAFLLQSRLYSFKSLDAVSPCVLFFPLNIYYWTSYYSRMLVDGLWCDEWVWFRFQVFPYLLGVGVLFMLSICFVYDV